MKYIEIMNPYVSEVTCPPVQVVDKASADTKLAVYGTKVTFTCVTGYWFSAQRAPTQHVSCLDTGAWSNVIPDCASKLYNCY